MEMAAVLYILKAEKVALNPPNPFGKRTFASPVEQNEGPTGPKSDATYVYVGQHFVEGRVKILKILNPSAYFTQTEYLWAHVQVRSHISSPCSHITDTHTHHNSRNKHNSHMWIQSGPSNTNTHNQSEDQANNQQTDRQKKD